MGVFVSGIGLTAGATTYGLFSDAATGTGSIQAAESFDETPPGEEAWDDQDGDGFYDSGEPTYTEENLTEFDEPSANLIIPNDMGKIKAKNNNVSINAGSIQSEVRIESGTGHVTLTATHGNVTITDSLVKSKNKAVTIITNDTLNIYDTTLDAEDEINISAKEISAQRANIKSGSEYVTLSATDRPLSLSSATVEAPTGYIQLRSDGDMEVDSATLKTKHGGMITANLTTATGTLFVDSADIQDTDDTLIYEPNVTLSGTPKKGCVEQSDGSTRRCG